MRAVVLVIVSLLLTGCADDGPRGPRPDAEASTVTGGSASPSTPSSRGCRPTHHVTIRKRVPTVLYALRFEARPGQRARGDQDATLYTYPEVSPGVFVTQPRRGLPNRLLTDAVLADVPQGSPVLDGSRGLAWDVRNRTGARARYLAYGGAVVYRGDWTATTCDGARERLSGTVVVVGRVHAGVVRCHGRPGAGPVRRVAERTACTHDSSAARPFRVPSG